MTKTGKSKYKTIPLHPKTYNKLKQLKDLLNEKSWDRLIAKLIDYYHSYKKAKVHLVMCNNFKETQASLPGWIKLLRKYFDDDLLAEAMGYLTPTMEKEVFKVDKDKCEGVVNV